jgi:hypothetical protein
VSVYEWPSDVEEESGDDPEARQGFFRQRRRELDLDVALDAGRTTRPRGTRRARDRARRMNVVFGAPTGPRNLWLPLGPTSIVGGQAANSPRVAGRVRALAVHDQGERLYAASANGGVWYSENGGGTWRPVGALAATDAAGVTRPAHRYACGAILVKFGANAAADLVLVGTGELTPETGGAPGSALGGVGILVATGPALAAAVDPWALEAKNLAGRGIYRFAAEPGGSGIVAATSIGLFQRPGAPGDWTRVAGDPFDTYEGVVTDVLWTAGDGARPGRLWAWATGTKGGLWVKDDGAAKFEQVDTPGAYNMRGVLAAASPPTKVYVLNNRFVATEKPSPKLTALYRVDSSGAAKPTATQVTDGIPNVLRNQGEYDITMAVDPGNADRIVIAGAYIAAMNTEGKNFESYNGSLMIGDVGLKGGKLTFGATAAPTMIGVGVHADVHDLRYAKNGARLFTSCDGGVFRSDKPTQQVGFVACNDGLSIAEANYVGSHPTCEGYLVVGLQDNGVIERASTGVWRVVEVGDGGGVLFDPVDTTRYLDQYTESDWRSSSGTGFATLLKRAGDGLVKDSTDEQTSSSFYSTPSAIKRPGTGGAADVTQVILGTDRVWYTEDWGTTWFTLPTGTDPITVPTGTPPTGGTYNRKQDQLAEEITVCKWATPEQAWVLTQRRFGETGDHHVHRLDKGTVSAATPGKWISQVQSPKRQGGKRKKNADSPDRMLEAVAWTDLAPNLDANGQLHGTKGAVYLGTAGHPDDADVDTLWWFDGDKDWHPTGLRKEAVPAPVTAVLCDPANPDHVYVGTTVGVWRGTRTLAANNPPDWVWEALVNGLPEAAVEDLSLYDCGGLRLLRAAIASRGVWEMPIDTDVADLTYLRAHDDDLRWRARTRDLKRDGTPGRSWHGSPDVRPRLAPGPVAKPATLPWTKGSGSIVPDTLRRFQAALRSLKNDSRSRATGVWDFYFEEVLRDAGAPAAAAPPPLPNAVAIDPAFWDTVMTAPHDSAEPWATALPSEADLYELTPKLDEGVVKAASCAVPAGKLRVEVVVHHRGQGTVDGADVRATLLHWTDPAASGTAKFDDSTTWFSGNVPWTDAVNEVLNSAAGTTAKVFADGWSFTVPAPNSRKTLAGQTLDPLHAGIVSFDLDLSGAKTDQVVLLVAVIRVGGDIALAPASLSDLAFGNPSVAVRSMRVT